MREILFRAKPIGSPGVWITGYFTKSPAGNCYITGTQVNSPEKCDPETVGQYTGKEDSRGNKIFEHDLVYIHNENTDEEDGAFEITWDNDDSEFVAETEFLVYSLGDLPEQDIEIIGNVWDIEKLLKED